MNYLKGYKPIELNKGDLKTLEMFSDIEEKDSNITDDLTSMLGNKEFEGSIFALRNKKEKKYKSIYIFKPEKDSEGNSILRFYKNVNADDVSQEAVKEFEEIILESLKEAVSLDETWKQIIWNDTVIEPRMIRIASINLSAGLFGLLFGLLLYVITGGVIWFILGICIGITSGAIVSKIGEKEEEENKEDNKKEKKAKKEKKKNKEEKSIEESNRDTGIAEFEENQDGNNDNGEEKIDE